MYTLIYHPHVSDDIAKITLAQKKRIKKALENKLMTHPDIYGAPLHASLSGNRKLRVGDYRIVYRIEPQKKCFIIMIAHRRDVYGQAVGRV